MISSTTRRIENNMSQERRARLDQQLKESISKYQHADQQQIDHRLVELDREWDIERMVEVEAPLMIGLGAALGMLHSPKWFGLSAIAASMVILHNTHGWYPLLPVFQRMGIRSQNDIEQERSALRVLRKDQEAYVKS